MYKAIEDIKKLVEVEKQGMKEVQLEIIAKVDAQITSHNQKLRNFKEERQKLYEEIEMLQETINAKDKANKNIEETME